MNITITRNAWNDYTATVTFADAGMTATSFNAKTASEATQGAVSHVQSLEKGAGISWGK